MHITDGDSQVSSPEKGADDFQAIINSKEYGLLTITTRVEKYRTEAVTYMGKDAEMNLTRSEIDDENERIPKLRGLCVMLTKIAGDASDAAYERIKAIEVIGMVNELLRYTYMLRRVSPEHDVSYETAIALANRLAGTEEVQEALAIMEEQYTDASNPLEAFTISFKRAIQ